MALPEIVEANIEQVGYAGAPGAGGGGAGQNGGSGTVVVETVPTEAAVELTLRGQGGAGGNGASGTYIPQTYTFGAGGRGGSGGAGTVLLDDLTISTTEAMHWTLNALALGGRGGSGGYGQPAGVGGSGGQALIRSENADVRGSSHDDRLTLNLDATGGAGGGGGYFNTTGGEATTTLTGATINTQGGDDRISLSLSANGGIGQFFPANSAVVFTNNVVLTGRGADDVRLHTGVSSFYFGAGTLTVTGNVVSMADGDDSLTLDLWGNQRSFTFSENTLDGGGGTDTLHLLGGRGVTLDMTAQKFTGFERVVGDVGADRITGTNYGEQIVGEDGSDTLLGGQGDDQLWGGDGQDLLNGQSGFDTAMYADAADAVTVNLQAGRATGAHGTDVLQNMEGVIAGAGDDVLTGNNVDNLLQGAGGNDTLTGGLGNDSLDGGDGVDTASYHTARNGVTVTLGGSAVGAGSDWLLNIENLTGSAYADRLVGDDAANSLRGENGDDTLVGGSGSDTLFGGDGADVVRGGTGYDVLRGGAGADVFVFDAGDTAIGETRDEVSDFVVGQDQLAFALAPDGPQVSLADGDAFTGVINQVLVEVRGNYTFVSVDTDGDADADHRVALKGVAGLSAAEFYVGPSLQASSTAADGLEDTQTELKFTVADVFDRPVTYSVAQDQGDPLAFAVDPYTGRLTFLGADFDAPTDQNADNVYEATVLAAVDGVAAPLSQFVQVTVLRGNQAPVIRLPEVSEIAENASDGLNVSVSDDDGGAPVLTLSGGADAGLFVLRGGGDGYTLAFADPQNFESPTDADGNGVYEVELSADDGSAVTTETLLVTLTDVNEAPSISNQWLGMRPGHVGAVNTVRASDVDGDTLQFELLNTYDRRYFIIDTETGVLSTLTSLYHHADENRNGTYELQVRVTDPDGQSAIAWVVVQNDVNMRTDPSPDYVI